MPPTPNGLVLNLNRSDEYEGKLKQKVLGTEVSIVGAIGAGTTAVYGTSGIGKICAVIAVGNDKDVQNHYSGETFSHLIWTEHKRSRYCGSTCSQSQREWW